MMVWKMICLFQGCILRFHVNLPGCIPLCTGFHTCFWCFAGFLNHQLPSLSGCDLAISSSWNWIAPGAVLKRKEQPNRERNMFNTTTLSHQQHQCIPHKYTWNPNDLYFWKSTPQNKANLPIKTRVSWVPGTYTSYNTYKWWRTTRLQRTIKAKPSTFQSTDTSSRHITAVTRQYPYHPCIMYGIFTIIYLHLTTKINCSCR